MTDTSDITQRASKPKCNHGHTYGTCLMCYHDLVAEQQSKIERLKAECTRLLERGDKAELQLHSAHAALARRSAPETRASDAMREAGRHVFCGATPNWIDHAGDCDALPCTCGLSDWLNTNKDLLGITLSPTLNGPVHNNVTGEER